MELLPFCIPLLSLFIISRAASDQFLECIVSNNQFQEPTSPISQVIFTPESSSYPSILDSTVQNLRPFSSRPLRPLLIITPLHESHIQAALYCSRETGTQIRVRSGGHDYEGLSYVSDNPFAILDMRNFRSISVDVETNTAWVQAGATLGELYYAIAEKSNTLAFTAGVCPTVGVAGHLSGGGYGMMSRKHGIAADHIVDAKFINADGLILDRENMGEDLFWAVRGGGVGSFGVLVAFRVKLVVVPETVTSFHVDRTSEQNATQLIYKWQHIADKIDDNLLIRLLIRSIASSETGNRTIKAYFTTLFLGVADDLLSIMQEQFPELGLVREDCTEMRWIESELFCADFPQNTSLEALKRRVPLVRHYFKAKSDFVKQPIPEEGLTGLLNFLHEEDEHRASLQFSPYGGKLNHFSESEIPFPHRAGNIFMIHYYVSWENPGKEESDRHDEWISTVYDYMTPYASESPRAAYFNYRDLEIGKNRHSKTSYEEASIWGLKYFKNNFKRLVLVKTSVDPTNVFRNEQSIPPLVSSLQMNNFSYLINGTISIV